MIQDSVRKWSLQLIETPNVELRKFGGLKFPVPNIRIEETIASALAHGCRKLDMFFMVWDSTSNLQRRNGHVAILRAADKEVQLRYPRLQFFISPMGPFLDPGCGAFEDPKVWLQAFLQNA